MQSAMADGELAAEGKGSPILNGNYHVTSHPRTCGYHSSSDVTSGSSTNVAKPPLLTKPQRRMQPNATFPLSRCPLPSGVRPGAPPSPCPSPRPATAKLVRQRYRFLPLKDTVFFPILLFSDLCHTAFHPRPTANPPLETHAVPLRTNWQLCTGPSDTEEEELSSEKCRDILGQEAEREVAN